MPQKVMPQKTVSIRQAQAKLSRPWVHTVVGQVDDYCAYLCRFQGTYQFHRHAKDEMYMVLEGETFIEYQDGPTVLLQEGDTLVVKAGETHRSGAPVGALVLMFKALDLFAE
jgi:mannose-6-phosphate isomerase-like protein (cupin superfamily)